MLKENAKLVRRDAFIVIRLRNVPSAIHRISTNSFSILVFVILLTARMQETLLALQRPMSALHASHIVNLLFFFLTISISHSF